MARLIFNGGSSSWKCGVYDVAANARAADAARPLAEVRLSWTSEGGDDAVAEMLATDGTRAERHEAIAHASAVPRLFALVARCGVPLEELESVGHRIVHGADRFTETIRLDEAALASLATLAPFAPSHNPIELAAVAAVRARLPSTPQYAVFDTQFHRTLAPEAYVYPGPAAWRERGIRRYGFHGTSVAYACERAAALLGRPLAELRLIVAHLGGGCSVTAVDRGASVDTSMGFTPLDGTMMATRSGEIDPGIALYLLREGSSVESLDRTLNHESGLAGVSGISGDLRAVRAAAAAGDERARLAVGLFVHRLAATVAGLRASLEGLDALVFTGGIGEHDAGIRAATAERLGFLGIAIDPARDVAGVADAAISAPGAAVATLVVTAREEWYIAREGARLADLGPSRARPSAE